MDKIVQGIKIIMGEEVKHAETSLLSKIWFMTEPIHMEVQQELIGFNSRISRDGIERLQGSTSTMGRRCFVSC